MVTAGEYIGAIAFARTGDPQFGDFDGAIILGRFGETPNRLPGFLVDDEDVGVRMVNLDHFERTGDPNMPGPAVVAFMILCSPRRLARFCRSISLGRAMARYDGPVSRVTSWPISKLTAAPTDHEGLARKVTINVVGSGVFSGVRTITSWS